MQRAEVYSSARFFVYRGESLVGLVGLTHAHTWLTTIRGGANMFSVL